MGKADGRVLNAVPFTRDLVLLGGGHAHSLVLKAWGMNPLAGVRVTLIDPRATAPYTGMLPGHIAGHYTRDELDIDLVRLCRHAGARLVLDRVVGIDRSQREVKVAGRGPVAYDVASLNLGITSRMNLLGFAEHGVAAKPLGAYARRWEAFFASVECGEVTPDVAVIGGGVAGCELAMAMAFRLAQVGASPRVTVIEAGPTVSGLGSRARMRLLEAMERSGIALRTNAIVRAVRETHVEIEGAADVPAGLCVGAAGAFPHGWLAQTDLPLKDGFIEIGPDLGVLGDDTLFAVGDCAVMPSAPRPKAGVFAVRAAPVLHRNLRAALGVGTRQAWRPQRSYLKLVSLGEKSALAEKGRLVAQGPSLWRWKDRIDRAFMRKLGELPPMPPPPLPSDVAAGVADMLSGRPLCGGCGAKVGRNVLSGSLDRLALPSGDVVTGAGDDAAVLRLPGGSYQVISTDHLRAFVEDPERMTRIAAVHALGDVWAMGAEPQVALATIVLPQMAAALQARTLREITDAAVAVLGEAGARLVGGHTTLGAELTIGFTVTGTRAVIPLTVSGAKVGDALILTRPIGSGVILAAEMQGRARGRDVVAALDSMTRPQGVQAAILGRVAHAMTDVTGFGLAGHLRAICAGSGLGCDIERSAIPVYEGARELSADGVASSLMEANRADAPVEGLVDPLLHDPQTAGGLLAAVPTDTVEATVRALSDAGCAGYVIGRLVDGAVRLRLI